MKFLLNELDMTSQQAADRYEILTGALVKESRQGMIGHYALSPRSARRLKDRLINIGASAVDYEEAHVSIAMRGMTESASSAAFSHLGIDDPRNRSDALSEAHRASEEASESYLLGEFTSQVNRDVNQTLKEFRDASLRSMMKSDLGSISRDQANETVLLEELRADRKLFYKDSMGRKVPSRLHIKRQWRMVARDHWMQTYLQTLTSLGVSETVIWHPDVSHRNYGQVLRMSEENYGLEDMTKTFHPNSRAIPVAKSYMEKTA